MQCEKQSRSERAPLRATLDASISKFEFVAKRIICIRRSAMDWRMRFELERNGLGPFGQEILGLYKTPNERESSSSLIPRPKAYSGSEHSQQLSRCF